ncbi:MAG: tRNA (adenosine(37)-N6)-threonylcarbamoyltransferase complex dimerization subunit type 1 TsaB [Gemmatales bacterium]
MRLLLLETSGTVGRLGLANDAEVLADAMLDRGQRHARDLMPRCQELFVHQGWQPRDVDAIAVSMGPGSYTGLRVGVMTAKTLAYALSKPLLAIPTFSILAQQCYAVDPDLSTLQVIGDGQQDRVYVQRYTSHTEASNLVIESGDAWRASLVAGETVTGPGLVVQQAQLPSHVRVLPEAVWHPQLPAMLALAARSFKLQQFADPFSLEPLYLRVSAAEEQWTAMGK